MQEQSMNIMLYKALLLQPFLHQNRDAQESTTFRRKHRMCMRDIKLSECHYLVSANSILLI